MNQLKYYQKMKRIIERYVFDDERIDLLVHTNNQIKRLEKKREEDQKRRYTEREEDVLTEQLVDFLDITTDYMSLDEITENFPYCGATRMKILSRLTTLLKEGIVEKEYITRKNKKTSGYRLSQKK